MKQKQQEYLELIVRKYKPSSLNKVRVQELLSTLLSELPGGKVAVPDPRPAYRIGMISRAPDSVSTLKAEVCNVIGETCAELLITHNFDSTFDLMLRAPLLPIDNSDSDLGVN